MNQIRQGDVWLELVDALPPGCTELPREKDAVILARGEATGHAHRVVNRLAKFWQAPNNQRYLTTPPSSDTVLDHEEHQAVTLERRKVYRVKTQVEYTPAGFQNVAD